MRSWTIKKLEEAQQSIKEAINNQGVEQLESLQRIDTLVTEVKRRDAEIMALQKKIDSLNATIEFLTTTVKHETAAIALDDVSAIAIHADPDAP